MAPPQFPDFLSHIGDLKIVSTGPRHLSLFIGDVHLGRQFYQPTLSLRRRRVRFAIAFKAHVAHRVAASLAATSPPTDESGRRAFLQQVKARTETLLETAGLETLLKESIEEMRVEESVDSILRGLHVVNGDLGQPFSAERQTQLEELEQSAIIMASNGQVTITGPEGSTPGSPLFERWLLSRQEGVSLLWSANRYGRGPEAFKAGQDQAGRLAKYEKEVALKNRMAEAGKYGCYRRAVLLKRFEIAAENALRAKKTRFSEADRVATCKECKEPDITFGQNTLHRCEVEHEKKDGKKMIIGSRSVESHFFRHLRVLCLHDLIDYPGVMQYVTEDDLTEMGIYSTPARDYLVDEKGNPLGSLPPGLDLSFVEDRVIWRREDTRADVLLASALDVALRAMAETQDEGRSNGRKLMRGNIYTPEQVKMWNGKFGPSVIAAVVANPRKVKVCIHDEEGCGFVSVRRATSTTQTQREHICPLEKSMVDSGYQSLEVSKLVGLPYIVQRFCVYMAIIEESKDFRRILMWN